MKLSRTLSFLINGDTFLLRSITEEDITQSYVESLRRQRAFLENNPKGIDISWQKNYVLGIRESRWNTICGLFGNSKLIGTSGIQNIKPDEQATLGVFVLNLEDRGKGYGKLLVWASCYLVSNVVNVDSFAAGVKEANTASLRSFVSCGFKIVQKNQSGYRLELPILELHKPDCVKDNHIL